MNGPALPALALIAWGCCHNQSIVSMPDATPRSDIQPGGIALIESIWVDPATGKIHTYDSRTEEQKRLERDQVTRLGKPQDDTTGVRLHLILYCLTEPYWS